MLIFVFNKKKWIDNNAKNVYSFGSFVEETTSLKKLYLNATTAAFGRHKIKAKSF